MKYDIIAEALITMVKKGKSPRDAVTSLKAYLDRRGKSKVMRGLTKALNYSEIVQARRSRVVLEVAHEKDIAYAKQEASAYHDNQIAPDVRENDCLIGGWRLITTNTVIDNSFKKHLLNFYNRITT